ncbi:hypothetical protein V6N11_053166 [Hibiscus sabdariffa]|uniref:Uncharacterized protein n=1 Tax=Hibiscus sabdariffa TaxID=183260 RepID=A0ABR2UCJ6_9ROSI
MACPRRRFSPFLWLWRSGRGSRRPPRYANVATSEYVPTPNPSTTTEHKTLSVSEDEYTKFFQYQVAKLLPGLSSVIRGKSSRSDTVVARVVNQIPFSRKWRRRKVKRRWAGLDSKQARRFTKLV